MTKPSKGGAAWTIDQLRQPLSTVDGGRWTKTPPELSTKRGLRKQHWTIDYEQSRANYFHSIEV